MSHVPHPPAAQHAPAPAPAVSRVPVQPAPAGLPIVSPQPAAVVAPAHAPVIEKARPAAPAPAHAHVAPPPPAPPAAAVEAVAAATNGHLAGKLGNLGLSPQQVDAVLALSREVVERVVWEVVPQLAETIIKEEIARLTKEA
jgi:hypothetical protein